MTRLRPHPRRLAGRRKLACEEEDEERDHRDAILADGVRSPLSPYFFKV
jgi:hypothetical protein